MKANYEDKIPKKTSEVSLGNLYDINKQVMFSQPKVDAEILAQKKADLREWITMHAYQHYFMMLCHERRDYTIFNFTGKSLQGVTIADVDSMTDDVIECLTNRGTLLALDLQDAGGWEFWIKDEDDAYMYLMFPYGAAVLEY